MRTIALSSIVALCSVVCGCGNGNGETPQGDKPTTPDVKQGDPGAGPTSGEEPGAATQESGAKPSGTKQAGTGDPAPAGLQPIVLKLPKPLFIGTPKNLRVPNLEKPTGKPRPPFLAPAGVTNVALGKSVTGSDDEPIIGEMEYVTDGEKSGADGSYVDLAFGPQWIQIDLGSLHALNAIVIWHYHQEGRVYHDVVVQIADDADFISGVRTLFNNDDDNSAGLGVGKDRPYLETHEGKLVDVKGAKARYVRLYSRGNTSNDQNHYVEVEVYGKPSP